MNSTSLEKTQSPVSGFCNARNRVCNAVFLTAALKFFSISQFLNHFTFWFHCKASSRPCSTSLYDILSSLESPACYLV